MSDETRITRSEFEAALLDWSSMSFPDSDPLEFIFRHAAAVQDAKRDANLKHAARIRRAFEQAFPRPVTVMQANQARDGEATGGAQR